MGLQVAQDLKEEAGEFDSFLRTLSPEDWEQKTLFMGWTPWDVVAHLHYFDQKSLAALEGETAFAAERKRLLAAVKAGRSMAEVARQELGPLRPEELLDAWKAGCESLSDALAERNPKERMPWFGPDMGVSMFTTARYMETWAHSQAVYDLKKTSRTHSDRIRNIVAIGVKTFGWTFVNRKREVPGPPPYLELSAPSGVVWRYNEPSDTERIEGTAVDFCLTVTQVRNVRDTSLRVTGDVAKAWMEIAQCFAGGPVDPPAPGVRLGA